LAQAAAAPPPATAAPLTLAGIDLTAHRLLLAGGAFADTRLQVAAVAGGLQVRVDGADLAGSLSVPDADGAPVAGRFARLYWTPAAAPPDPQAAPPPVADIQGDGVDPSAMPPLSLQIDDLRLGQAGLGQAQLKTRRVAGGLKIEQLQIRAPKQRIDVSGDWLGDAARARTAIRLHLDSKDGGALLDGLGFGHQLRGGEGTLDLDVQWPGGPASFALARLQGGLKVDSRNGALLEVEPGAGRVLGLLSIAQLPRRLMFDFRDFFSKGFSFNKVTGQVRFEAGQAHTDDLLIDGPAAQIRISGSADLRAQQYDQTIHVEPRAGNLLTVVGAVAGGPVGAAVGAAANAVLSKPLGQIGAKTYHVTGPWKEPKVDVVEHEDKPVPAQEAPTPQVQSQ
ncbi:MAG: AsmA-like C-terminal region-containing protein, partial [Pseudoxanthomonas sp.]